MKSSIRTAVVHGGRASVAGLAAELDAFPDLTVTVWPDLASPELAPSLPAIDILVLDCDTGCRTLHTLREQHQHLGLIALTDDHEQVATRICCLQRGADMTLDHATSAGELAASLRALHRRLQGLLHDSAGL